jgi:predicted nucleic acid-binding Zn ribbon protein
MHISSFWCTEVCVEILDKYRFNKQKYLYKSIILLVMCLQIYGYTFWILQDLS